MLGTGYFLKIAKINTQQAKLICPNRKNLFPQNKKSPIRKINSYNNFLPHGISKKGTDGRFTEIVTTRQWSLLS